MKSFQLQCSVHISAADMVQCRGTNDTGLTTLDILELVMSRKSLPVIRRLTADKQVVLVDDFVLCKPSILYATDTHRSLLFRKVIITIIL